MTTKLASAHSSPTVIPGMGMTLLAVIVIRAIVLGTGLLTMQLRSDAPDPPLVWDEQSYLHVLEKGYPRSTDSPDLPLIAFFPLYPLMAWPLAQVMPSYVALLVVANVCSLIGYLFFYLWVRELASPRLAAMSVLLLATSVSAVYFSRAMTEGPFFMLVAITLWLMQKKRLLAAAAVCGLASLLRPTGVALMMLLALYALLQDPQVPWGPRLGRAALVGLIGIWGAIAYEAFLWSRYETPGIYFQAQENWQKDDERRLSEAQSGSSVPRYSLRFFLDRAATPQAWNRIFALGILVLTIGGFVRPGPMPRVLFVLPLVIFIMTALPNNGIRISSVLRYESPAVPLVVLVAGWLAMLKRQAITLLVLTGMLGLQIYYAVLFCRTVWVG